MLSHLVEWMIGDPAVAAGWLFGAVFLIGGVILSLFSFGIL